MNPAYLVRRLNIQLHLESNVSEHTRGLNNLLSGQSLFRNVSATFTNLRCTLILMSMVNDAERLAKVKKCTVEAPLA